MALVLAAPADEEFLLGRLEELERRYDEQARRQTDDARRIRGAILRELAHLPFDGEARERAGDLLARVVSTEPSYRLRAEAARAIGRIGTPKALSAMYGTLFGLPGRSRRFELLHAVLPEAVAALRRPDDLEWLAKEVLGPAGGQVQPRLFRQAGPLRARMVALTLEGVGRARARLLGPDVARLAGDEVSEVRAAALRALAALEWSDPAIARALRSPDPVVRAAAAGHPGLPPEEAAAALSDPAARVRRGAILGLAARDGREAVPLLVARLAEETEPVVRLDLREALNRLTGKELADADLWRSWWEANRDRFAGPVGRDDSGRTYFFELAMRTERVAFLIDVSASMSRQDERGVSRLDDAARELRATISGLSPTARFVILAFAAEVRRFPDDAQGAIAALGPGNRTSASAAADWLLALKPAGATNTYGALMEALHDERFAPDAIVLLSDGNPYRCAWRGRTWSEHEQILAAVREANADRGIRIHTVALLSGARTDDDEEDAQGAADFLRRLAADNGGDFREIR